MKRTTIEFMIGWLDALRRDDVEALKATLSPDVVWRACARVGLPRRRRGDGRLRR